MSVGDRGYIAIKGNDTMKENKIQLTEIEGDILKYISDNEISWFQLQNSINC